MDVFIAGLCWGFAIGIVIGAALEHYDHTRKS